MPVGKFKTKVIPNNFKIPRPKITFGRLGQITFTLKEITKLALKIKPKIILLLFLTSAVWGFLAVPGFYLEKFIIDRLIASVGQSDWQAHLVPIGALMLIALLLSLGRNLLGSFNRFLRDTMARYFDAELSAMLGKKLSELDMEMIDDPDFQDRFNKVTSESSRRVWSLMVPISDIPNYVVGFLTSVGVLVLLNPLIAIGALIASLPQFLVDSKYIRKEYELHTSLTFTRRLIGWTDHYLLQNRNYMELKNLGISNYLVKKLKSAWQEILIKRIELGKKRLISGMLSNLPLTAFELVVALFLIFWVIIERITVGSFQLYLRSLRNAEQNLSGLVNSFVQIFENYMYVTDLIWFLNLESSIEKSDESKKPVPKNFDIALKNVSFKYKKNQKLILKGVNLHIRQGEKIAIVGENGAGKTTLIKLISRFYDPSGGKVMINGENIDKFRLSDWRANISILFQDYEGYIYSAHESIGFGDVLRIDDEKNIKKAAKMAGIHEYIESLPLSYATPLNPRFDKGVSPSTGQLQRVGIARTLFREDAKIVILDEPTSNIDPKAEEQIFNKLLKRTQDRIFIFVSQRFSTVRRADRIIVMESGKIVEDGSHKELMEKKGLYEELFTLQAKAYQ